MAQKTGPLVVIDGHNTLIRNYVRSPYMTADGERAGGTTGMVVSVRKLINDLSASNVIVVWDGEGGSQRRKSIASEYKAGRTVRLNRADDDMAVSVEEQRENFNKQFAVAKEYLTLLGIPQVRCDGVEADDIMAYIAGKMDHPGGCILVTTDQDMLQLIRAVGDWPRPCDSEKGHKSIDSGDDEIEPEFPSNPCVRCGAVPVSSEVKVWSPIKKVLYDRQRFISDYGVLPENFRLVKALTGDSSDNIDGVKGFGTKTVAKSFPFLLEKKSTATDVLTAGEALKGVLGKRLTEAKNQFLENLTLVDLSEPMLSATAARQAREALRKDLGCKEVDFRVRVIRDGITFNGDNFAGVFREFVMRRRRLLATMKPEPAEGFGLTAAMEDIARKIDAEVIAELNDLADGENKSE